MLPENEKRYYIKSFSDKINTLLKNNILDGGYSISKWDMYATQNLNGGSDDDEQKNGNASNRATMETLKLGNTDTSKKTSGTTASETLQKLTKELEEIQARLKKLNNPLL